VQVLAGLDVRVEASFLFQVASGMTVRVLLFASYADALGGSEVVLDLPSGAKVRDVRARVKSLAAGKRVPEQPLIAVNQRYANDDQLVVASDEVAIIPPVAGG
jgi:molybdopterin synthase sulfur carrier subunit